MAQIIALRNLIFIKFLSVTTPFRVDSFKGIEIPSNILVSVEMVSFKDSQLLQGSCFSTIYSKKSKSVNVNLQKGTPFF